MEECSLRVRVGDYVLLAVYGLVLFGYAGISGRPLTMHEARLPETAREMKERGNFLLPSSGIRPWLERPPLPHWVVIASMKMFGMDDQVWVARLPSAIMGAITVLLVAGIGGRFFGRTIGVLSGFILAASYEFTQYAGMAEDDIYLAALVAICMALFCRNVDSFAGNEDQRLGIFSNRHWTVWAFFIVLGLTNLTKGPLLGLAVVGITVGPYLLWTGFAERRWDLLWRYFWGWGWLIAIALTVAWPMWAYHRYPDVLANWKYDYLGRVNGQYTDINQPWFYYSYTIAIAMLPWTPACLVGLLVTGTDLFRKRPVVEGIQAVDRKRPLRLIWCWAILPLILFSIPKGKHHHYLIPFLAPWAIVGAFGAVEIGKWLSSPRIPAVFRNPVLWMLVLGFPGALAIAWFHQQIPGPMQLTALLMALWIAMVGSFFVSLKRSSGGLLMTVILCAWIVGSCWVERFVAARTDHTLDDTRFLERVRLELPVDQRLFINAELEPPGNLDFFRMQFYLPKTAMLLHNLSYLRDENIHEAQVLVITRARDAEKLKQLGKVEVVDQSEYSHDTPGGAAVGPWRFTLFLLSFDPNLKRYPAPMQITNLQAMQRDRSGPWCGPPL